MTIEQALGDILDETVEAQPSGFNQASFLRTANGCDRRVEREL